MPEGGETLRTLPSEVSHLKGHVGDPQHGIPTAVRCSRDKAEWWVPGPGEKEMSRPVVVVPDLGSRGGRLQLRGHPQLHGILSQKKKLN